LNWNLDDYNCELIRIRVKNNRLTDITVNNVNTKLAIIKVNRII